MLFCIVGVERKVLYCPLRVLAILSFFLEDR